MRFFIILMLMSLPTISAAQTTEIELGKNSDESIIINSEKSVNVVDNIEDTKRCPPKSIYGRSFAKEKKVALTFDDGPFEFYTDKVLDVLKKYGVKVTFFLLGKKMEEHPEIVKRIYKEGHAIGMHAYDHSNLKYESNEGLYTQIQKNQKIFNDILNIKPQLFRPPYGAITPEQVKYIFDRGITTTVWSVNSYDSYPDRNNVDTIYDTVTKKVYPGAIILFHDKSAADFPDEDYSNTIKILPNIIEFLQEEEYRFYMLPELLNENNLPEDPDKQPFVPPY